MKPKDRAKELIEKFMMLNKSPFITYPDIQGALICVDEILKEVEGHSRLKDDATWELKSIFWQEVKQEIEKL